jgi:L-ribulose-5-phosphate 4-epimerase
MLEELREQLRLTALEMMKSGLVHGTDGNVSARDWDTGYIVVTPSGMPYEQIRTQDIVIVDVDGKVVWGQKKPSWETPMHTYVFKHNPQVGAVMHTHSYYAMLMSIAGLDLPPTTMNIAATFGGTVPCCPYVRTGSADVGRVALETMGETGKAVLLGNHGTLAIADDLATVLQISKTLEEGAKLHYQAACMGVPPRPLPPDEVKWLYDLVQSFKQQEKKEEEKAKVAERSHP